ncbi:hypothetical protein, partial [Salinivibrio sp. VYel6]|uniref:hypothetical protein n=1 Tax=Salinivibrio sp. VYel6 TaxID=2490493 RepID=UPI00156259F5
VWPETIKLPVTSTFDSYIVDATGNYVGDMVNAEVAEAVMKAINSHEQLTKECAALRERMREHGI